MHKLLARQIRKATENSTDGQVDLACLISMIDQAYEEGDRERRLKDRALNVMQGEVEAMSRRIVEEAELRFNLVMDNVGEAVVIFDSKSRIEGFNRAAELIFGYLPEEIRGQDVSVLMTTGSDEDFQFAHLVGSDGGELLGKRKRGTLFPVEVAVGKVESAIHSQYICVIRDVTLRRQAESELRESESRFRDLAGSASDWFWETDPDYRLTFVSERIANVLGVKPAAILGNTWFEIGLDDVPESASAHLADIMAREPFRDLVFAVGVSGAKDYKVLRLSGIPFAGHNGEFAGYRGVGADITREAVAVQQAIHAQQQLYDAINSITDAIAVYDADERLVICNQAYANTLDTEREFLVPGITFEQVMRHGYDRHFFDLGGQEFQPWLEGRMKRFRNADGVSFVLKLESGRWVQSRECSTREGGVVAVRTDITQLKRREEELDALRRRYALILDSAGEGIVGLDHCGRVTFANRMAGEIIGRQSGEMVGRCFYCLIRGDEASCDGPCPASESPLVSAYLSGTPGQVIGDVLRDSDRRIIPVDFFIAPLMEDDKPTGAVLVFRDATQRLQYEQTREDQQRELERIVAERTVALQREIDVRAQTESALRRSRERIKGITDSLFEGVLVVDGQGLISFANPSAKQFLDYAEEGGDIEGHPLDILMHLRTPEDDLGFADGPFHEALARNVTLRNDDAVFVTAAGKPLSVAFACSPIGETEAKRSVIISFRNIEALKKAQREALQSSRLASVGQLAAGIAHEINTPVQYVSDNLRFIDGALTKLMTAIVAARELAATAMPHADLLEPVAKFNELLTTAKIPFLMAEVPAAVSESLDGVAQIARIVLSMKEFSHPGTSTKTMTDINRALESTLTVSHNVWKHGAEVVRIFDPLLPPVLCHAGELNQVFLNLIVNATHAIEGSGKPLPGQITITTSHDNGIVEIRVADTGTGVPPAIKDRIFDPFFTTKDVGVGTGQGLAICRDVVVSKHGGSLEVAGEPGDGAVFIIRLPVDAANRTGAEE